MLNKYFEKLIVRSSAKNIKNIISFAENNTGANLLDLGCDDGYLTERLSGAIGCNSRYGVEISPERSAMAEQKGIKIYNTDLNSKLPFESNFFDVVLSNQVVEHLYNTDLFLSEILRVLRPGGYAIISTENLSSWHNIFALVLGFQPFSMANFSVKGTIGNPLSLWNNKTSENSSLASWQHIKLFSYFGLKDLVQKHGFTVEGIKTAGYYPLPFDLSTIEKLHGHWITLKLRKLL